METGVQFFDKADIQGVPVSPGSAPDISPHRGYYDSVYDQLYQDYISSIEDLKGTPYYDQLLNHSGAQFAEYVPKWLERVFDNRRGVTEFYNNRFASAYQAADQARDSLRQQGHNSEAAVVARRSAAGLNTDLSGGQGVPSAAAPDAVSDSVPPSAIGSFPSSGIEEDLSQARSFADIGMSFASAVMGFVSGCYDLGLKSSARVISDIAALSDAYDYNLKTLGNAVELPRKEDGSVDYSAIPDLFINNDQPVFARATSRTGRVLGRTRTLVTYDKDGKMSTPLRVAAAKNSASIVNATVQAGSGMATPGYSEDDLKSFAAAYNKAITQPQIHLIEIDSRLADIDFSIRKFEERIAQNNAEISDATKGSNISIAGSQARSAAARASYDENYTEYSENLLTPDLGISESNARKMLADLDSMEAELKKEQAEVFKRLADHFQENPGLWSDAASIMIPGLYQDMGNVFELRRQRIRERRESLQSFMSTAGMLLK